MGDQQAERDSLSGHLVRLVGAHDATLWSDPQRLAGLLADLCPGSRRADRVALVQALQAGVPGRLRIAVTSQGTARLSASATVAPSVAAFRQSYPVDDDTAAWAVETWAAALGIEVRSATGGEMSNPHYARDLEILNGRWDLDLVMSDKTLVITVGMNVCAELLDRPIAEVLRDAIDSHGVLEEGKRAIVVVDAWWLREEQGLQRLSTIAIGGPGSNVVTEMIAKYGPDPSSSGSAASMHHGRVRHPGRTQTMDVALWGDDGIETAQAVRSFIARDLEQYLSEAWR